MAIGLTQVCQAIPYLSEQIVPLLTPSFRAVASASYLPAMGWPAHPTTASLGSFHPHSQCLLAQTSHVAGPIPIVSRQTRSGKDGAQSPVVE